jgi:hypothetical protein
VFGANWPVFPVGLSFRSDYASNIESEGYLEALDGQHDGNDYLALIDLGDSPMLDWPLSSSWPGPEFDRPFLVARVADDPSAQSVTRPAILLVCGLHAHEWIPQEVCLGYVDYLVKAANDEAPYAVFGDDVRDLLDEVEIWVAVQANPGGRLRDEWKGGLNPDLLTYPS